MGGRNWIGAVTVAREAAGDRRTILGVADRVPVDADLGRLEAIPALVGKNRGEP